MEEIYFAMMIEIEERGEHLNKMARKMNSEDVFIVLERNIAAYWHAMDAAQDAMLAGMRAHDWNLQLDMEDYGDCQITWQNWE